MTSYIKLLRVKHYIKNLLVYVALLCSGQFFNIDKLLKGTKAFLIFCLVSSFVYIINDIKDAEKDRMHPTKKYRPIASGEISVKNAIIIEAVLILAVGILVSYDFNIKSTTFIIVYLLLNILYSFGLKNIPIVDVVILSSGFLIRVLFGGSVTGIEVSNWLYLTVLSISFYLALGKRRNELKKMPSGKTREVLKHYSESYLDKMMYICLGIAIVFYSLWAAEKSADMGGQIKIIWTVPVVLMISMAYSKNVEGDSDGDPVEVLLHDKLLIVLCLAYVVMMGLMLYI